MANTMYSKCKESFISQNPSIDLDTDNIKCSLVRASAYTPNYTTDQYLDPAATTRVADSANLAGKSVTNGVFDATDITFSAVGAGAAIDFVLVWKDTTVATTSPLICNFDTGTGLPVTPNGGDITVAWDSGANKIFAL